MTRCRLSPWTMTALLTAIGCIPAAVVYTNASATTHRASAETPVDLPRTLSQTPPDVDGAVTLSTGQQPVARYTMKHAPPGSDSKPSGASTRASATYLYSSARTSRAAQGMSANVTIATPSLASADFHTLAELAAQSTDGQQIVEIGWTVDRSTNKDAKPHLFVYHWVDRQTSCYNGCGFVQVSSKIKPGDSLPSGSKKFFGILHHQGNWWVAYDTEWVGYFPGSLWNNKYTEAGLTQWFGEVAAGDSRPCTDMGTGSAASSSSSAEFTSMKLYSSTAASTPSLNAYTPNSSYYSGQLSGDTYRFGGPGAC